MTTFHQVRSPLIATVAAVTLVLAGHATRQADDETAHAAAPMTAVSAMVERAVEARADAVADGSPVAVVQLQSDLDLVGASIGAYDR
jgi:hypothetical protein